MSTAGPRGLCCAGGLPPGPGVTVPAGRCQPLRWSAVGRRPWGVLACLFAVTACSEEQQDTTATIIGPYVEPICVLAEGLANLLVNWRGGSLPSGLDDACQGLLSEWALGRTRLDVQVQTEGRLLDLELPVLPEPATAITISPDLQAALDRLRDSMDDPSGP